MVVKDCLGETFSLSLPVKCSSKLLCFEIDVLNPSRASVEINGSFAWSKSKINHNKKTFLNICGCNTLFELKKKLRYNEH